MGKANITDEEAAAIAVGTRQKFATGAIKATKIIADPRDPPKPMRKLYVSLGIVGALSIYPSTINPLNDEKLVDRSAQPQTIIYPWTVLGLIEYDPSAWQLQQAWHGPLVQRLMEEATRWLRAFATHDQEVGRCTMVGIIPMDTPPNNSAPCFTLTIKEPL